MTSPFSDNQLATIHDADSVEVSLFDGSKLTARAGPVRLDRGTAELARRVFAAKSSFNRTTAKCAFIPDVEIRFSLGVDSVSIQLSFECDRMRIAGAPSHASGEGDRDFSATHDQVVVLARNAFPGDKTLESLPRKNVLPPTKEVEFGDDVEGLGSGSQAAVMNVVVSHKPEIVACVREQQRREPALHGTLSIRWSLTAQGRASAVAVRTKQFESQYIAACLIGLIKSWEFPPGTASWTEFPFKF